jgi:hypothetical protein
MAAKKPSSHHHPASSHLLRRVSESLHRAIQPQFGAALSFIFFYFDFDDWK